MNLRTIKTLTKKEFLSYFNTPVAYLFIGVFVSFSAWLFWSDFFIRNHVSMRPYFALLPWFLIIIVPALTMRAWAEEKKTGTIEQLLTLPISNGEAVLGKFFAALAFMAVTLLFSSPIVFVLSQLGSLDLGIVLSSYLGTLLFISSLISLGLFVSSLTNNQIAAFLVSALGSFVFYILGTPLVTNQVPTVLKKVFTFVGMAAHTEASLRGVLDIRDLIYFISITVLFLFLNATRLRYRDRDAGRSLKINISTQIGLVTGILIIGTALTYVWPMRWDLSHSNANSLTNASQRLVREADDVITIKTYFSEELPPQFSLLKQYTNDLLADYERYSQGNVSIIAINPKESEDIEQGTQAVGIPLLQFNEREQDRFEISNGYLGITITYRDQTEVIPVINDPSILEYQISSAIVTATRNPEEGKPTVAFVTGHGERTHTQEHSTITQALNERFNVRVLDFTTMTEVPDDIDTIILSGTSEELPDSSLYVLDQFIAKGVGILIMTEGVEVSPELQATSRLLNLDRILSPLGIELKKNVLLDRNNELVTFNNGFTNVIVPYPFWVRVVGAGINNNHITVNQLESAVFPWVSSLNLEEKEELTTLFNSSSESVSQTEPFDLSPQVTVDEDDTFSSRPIGAIYNGQYASVFTTENKPDTIETENIVDGTARVIVIGDSDFATDSIVRQFNSNGILFMNLIDYLTQDEDLIGIRAKNDLTRPIESMPDDQKKALYKYGTIILPIIFLIGIGIIRTRSRKKRKFTL